MPPADSARLAHDTGYRFVCIRASAGGVQTPRDELAALRRRLDELDLRVSMVTTDFNVPLNNVLARAAANDPDSVSLWRHYLRRWTIWNHVRTGASLAAATLLILAW